MWHNLCMGLRDDFLLLRSRDHGHMTPELKAQWIAALRSGEYTQGRYNLRTREGHYCCLGVLCMVLEKPDLTSTNYEHLRQASGLTISETDGCVELNDIALLSFSQIADYIEVYL